MYIQALEVFARIVHTLRSEQTHDANGQMDRSNRTNSFGRECRFAGIIWGGHIGGEALDRGLKLWA